MKILMLSIDKGLLGQGQLGDVVERHKKYSEFCDKLDIIVFNKLSFPRKRESRNPLLPSYSPPRPTFPAYFL